jgi:hypothetical protein
MSQVPEAGSVPENRPDSPPPRRGRWAVVLASLVTGLLLFGVGLVGGWVAASQKSAPVDSHGHAHGGGDDDGHAHAATPKLTPQTLANLGVEVGELRLTEFVRTRDVPATAAERPGSVVPASSLVAGIVEEVLVVHGQRVAAGAPVARVRRDAFPRPSLVLTEPVLRPLNEEFHDAMSSLRSTTQALEIAREDLARVRRAVAGAGDALPAKIEVDARNEERRALRALENAREEAERHGLTPPEIAGIESGSSPVPEIPPVQRVLARNGMWSEEASSLLASLPADVQKRPYAVAVVAELVGSRALTREMAAAVRARPELSNAFLDVAGLVQQGWTVEGITALADRGALAAVVIVHAPAGPRDRDVLAVRLRAGERAEPGATIVELRDLSRVQLELAPAGADLAAIASASTAGETLRAEPLVADAGPVLEDLRIQRVEAEGRLGEGAAIVPVENRVLFETKEDGRSFRSWAVRPGLRYLVRVPLARMKDRFVVPASAVASQGADSVVLLEDGSGFRAVPVRVEHRDARVAVLAADGAVMAGDRMVLKGAYAVLLALQAAAGGAVDPHAGHSH